MRYGKRGVVMLDDHSFDNDDDDYRWEIENGLREEDTGSGGSIMDIPYVGTFIGGLVTISIILSILHIDPEDFPSIMSLVFIGIGCWIWTKIRKLL